MIVVADRSPLIALVNIGHIQILPALFREVVIPPQIAAELADSKRPQTVQDFIREKPVWLRVQAPASVESMPELHEGERAAICLASELHADLLQDNFKRLLAYSSIGHAGIGALTFGIFLFGIFRQPILRMLENPAPLPTTPIHTAAR